MSLFRIIESAGGCIVIDGVRIDTLGLLDLRSRITILPQVKAFFLFLAESCSDCVSTIPCTDIENLLYFIR